MHLYINTAPVRIMKEHCHGNFISYVRDHCFVNVKVIEKCLRSTVLVITHSLEIDNIITVLFT